MNSKRKKIVESSTASTSIEMHDGVWDINFINGRVVDVTPQFKTTTQVNVNNVNKYLSQKWPINRAIAASMSDPYGGPSGEDRQGLGESVLKNMKKNGGKLTIKGPKVKERKKFAPATKVEKPKKGKGSYERKEPISESEDIKQFLDHLVFNNYAEANKCLQRVLEKKLSEKIKAELNTPLF